MTRAFVTLLDNYERETGKAEVFTNAEKREMDAFLDALCATPHMRFALAFLKKHGRDPRTAALRTMQDLKLVLFDLWFAPYRRYRPTAASADRRCVSSMLRLGN